MKIQSLLILALLITLALVCFLWPGRASAQLFTKVTTGAIATTPSGSRSCNFLDFNNDDFQDILITNGKTGGEDNLLYLNNGDGTFSPVASPLASDGDPSDGASCADFDNDGFVDAYVVNWYGTDNLLYKNSGGTFVKIDTGIVPNDGGYSETGTWGDYDRDGLLDLYVTNSSGTNQNYLYRNLGSGAFEKVTSLIPATETYLSRSINWIDYDLDGDQDLYVSNENNQKNNFYRNDSSTGFTKVSGDPIVSSFFATMSSSWADYDNDGDFDLFNANYQQGNQLFNNDGTGSFTQVLSPFGADVGCSFGSSFADYDNDGDLDLFVTNGYCGPSLRNYLYENNGDGTFSKNLTEPMATDQGSSYGCAWGDYDNNGFMDLVVANWRNESQANSLYRNNGNGNHWLKLNLEGTLSNRSAIGAIVKCKATLNGNPTWQMRDVSSQSGYCGQNSLVVHFGLGDAGTVDSLVVLWPSGLQQAFAGLARDKQYILVENAGITVGLNDLARPEPHLEIYPNPSDGDFMIELQGMAGKQLKLAVSNISGQVIHTRSLSPSSDRAHLEVSNVPEMQNPGVYLLTVSDEGGSLHRGKCVVLR